MNQLLDEARRMSDASKRFARGVSQVRTPDHLIPLRTSVRKDHGSKLRQLHQALDQRFGTTGWVMPNLWPRGVEFAVPRSVVDQSCDFSWQRRLR